MGGGFSADTGGFLQKLQPQRLSMQALGCDLWIWKVGDILLLRPGGLCGGRGHPATTEVREGGGSRTDSGLEAC
jgi:hypothetical protein